MLGKIWRSLVAWVRRLFGLAGSKQDLSCNNGVANTAKPLSDADFEYVFMQLLEAVAHGWSQGRILRFFEAVKDRATQAQWIEWLGRFGERLLASPAPNHVLAARMVQLGEQTQTIPSIRRIGEVAYELGAQLLTREQNGVVWEYEGPDADPTPLPHNGEEQHRVETPQDVLSQPVGRDEPQGEFDSNGSTASLEKQGHNRESSSQTSGQETPPPAPSPPTTYNRTPFQEAAEIDIISSMDELLAQMPENGDLVQQSDRHRPIDTTKPQILTEEPTHQPNAALASPLYLANAWFNQGVQLYQAGDLLAAIVSFNKAVEIKPDFAEAWNNRGMALSELGAWEMAIASYDKGTAIKPDFHQAWYNRGTALFNLKRWEEAVASFNNATAIKLDFHEAWYNLGVALFNLGLLEEAIASYDKAIAIKPDKHEAWNSRGYVLHKLRSWQEALDNYDHAIAIKPDFHEAWKNRGYVLQQLGRWDEALDSYETARKIKPD